MLLLPLCKRTQSNVRKKRPIERQQKGELMWPTVQWVNTGRSSDPECVCVFSNGHADGEALFLSSSGPDLGMSVHTLPWFILQSCQIIHTANRPPWLACLFFFHCPRPISLFSPGFELKHFCAQGRLWKIYIFFLLFISSLVKLRVYIIYS